MGGLQGTNIAAPIVPFTGSDTYATHVDVYGKGGYRVVATAAERDAIPLKRQSVGMLVYVQATNETYRLVAAQPVLTGACWVVASFGSGSGGAGSPLGNIDGGAAGTVYGGALVIDGGTGGGA